MRRADLSADQICRWTRAAAARSACLRRRGDLRDGDLMVADLTGMQSWDEGVGSVRLKRDDLASDLSNLGDLGGVVRRG